MNDLTLWIHAAAEWLDDIIPDLMLSTRGLCHLLIFVVVAGYKSSHARHRKIIGILAATFAGANAAEAYRVAVNFSQFSTVVQPPLTLVMLCVLFFVMYARGNVARMLPRSRADLMR